MYHATKIPATENWYNQYPKIVNFCLVLKQTNKQKTPKEKTIINYPLMFLALIHISYISPIFHCKTV